MRPKIFAIDIDGTITDTKGGRVDLDALAAQIYGKTWAQSDFCYREVIC